MSDSEAPPSSELPPWAAPRPPEVIPQGEARFGVSGNGYMFDVQIHASDSLVQSVANRFFDGEKPEPRTVMTINIVDQTVSIFPQLIAFSERLYQPKYRRLREIELDLPPLEDEPHGHGNIVDLVHQLPLGFIRDAAFGLGVIKEMRPLVTAIESIDKVTRLVISKHENTRVERSTFYLNATEYEDLRAAMSRITRRYQGESLADRQLMAHNASIHRALPDKYPYKERAYQPGTVFKLLGGSQSSLVSLRGKDRIGLVQAIAGNARSIADRDPKEFVQLQKDIEVVSLDQLIVAVDGHIAKNSNEGVWQKLLELNPFLLSILFGQPIVLLQAGASVGGQTLAGGGTKIADFLTKNALTGNAAIVELKRPKTPILSKKEYRGGVHAASGELMGAVAQVLDQRLKLVTGIAQTRYNSRIDDLEVTAVECVVVAGRTPRGEAALRSLELVRGSLKDVRIITFDELLERLQILRELLSGERYISNIAEDDADQSFLFADDEDDGFDEPSDGEAEDGRTDDEDRDPRA